MLHSSTTLLQRLVTKWDENLNLFENIENIRRKTHVIKSTLLPSNH